MRSTRTLPLQQGYSGDPRRNTAPADTAAPPPLPQRPAPQPSGPSHHLQQQQRLSDATPATTGVQPRGAGRAGLVKPQYDLQPPMACAPAGAAAEALPELVADSAAADRLQHQQVLEAYKTAMQEVEAGRAADVRLRCDEGVAVAALKRKATGADSETLLTLLKQREELERRNDSINAIQRNFLRLSELFERERSAAEAAREENRQLRDAARDRQAEKKVLAMVQHEFESAKVEAARREADLQQIHAQLSEVQRLAHSGRVAAAASAARLLLLGRAQQDAQLLQLRAAEWAAWERLLRSAELHARGCASQRDAEAEGRARLHEQTKAALDAVGQDLRRTVAEPLTASLHELSELIEGVDEARSDLPAGRPSSPVLTLLQDGRENEVPAIVGAAVADVARAAQRLRVVVVPALLRAAHEQRRQSLAVAEELRAARADATAQLSQADDAMADAQAQFSATLAFELEALRAQHSAAVADLVARHEAEMHQRAAEQASELQRRDEELQQLRQCVNAAHDGAAVRLMEQEALACQLRAMLQLHWDESQLRQQHESAWTDGLIRLSVAAAGEQLIAQQRAAAKHVVQLQAALDGATSDVAQARVQAETLRRQIDDAARVGQQQRELGTRHAVEATALREEVDDLRASLASAERVCAELRDASRASHAEAVRQQQESDAQRQRDQHEAEARAHALRTAWSALAHLQLDEARARGALESTAAAAYAEACVTPLLVGCSYLAERQRAGAAAELAEAEQRELAAAHREELQCIERGRAAAAAALEKAEAQCLALEAQLVQERQTSTAALEAARSGWAAEKALLGETIMELQSTGRRLSIDAAQRERENERQRAELEQRQRDVEAQAQANAEALARGQAQLVEAERAVRAASENGHRADLSELSRLRQAVAEKKAACVAALARLRVAARGCESAICCALCLQLLRRPISCVPCGHLFCDACLAQVPRNAALLPQPQSVGGGGSDTVVGLLRSRWRAADGDASASLLRSGRMSSPSTAAGVPGPLYCPECKSYTVTEVLHLHPLESIVGQQSFLAHAAGELEVHLQAL